MSWPPLAMNDFWHKLAKCSAVGSFPVFNVNNLPFSEINLSPLRFKLLFGFHSFFITQLGILKPNTEATYKRPLERAVFENSA